MNARPVVMRVRGLSKSFGGLKVLRGLSFDLHQGEVVLLRGVNGSGKTTLLNTLTGLLHPDAGSLEVLTRGRAFERVFLERTGRGGGHTPEAMAGLGIGRSWQEVRLFPHHTLEENVAVAHSGQLGEHPRNLFLRPGAVTAQERAIRAKAYAALEGLGLGGQVGDLGSRVSLGQAKRVSILRAVEAGAEILFLDEPLSGLDANGIKKVVDLVEELVASRRLTVVIVEHEFSIPPLLPLVDRVWTLEDGTLRESSPEVGGTGLENEIALQGWLRKTVGGGSLVHTQTLPGGATLLRVPGPWGTGDPIMELRDFLVRRGGRPLFTGAERDAGTLSFTLFRGELAVLQAPNGWGKTSLLDAVLGLIPSSGELRLEGIPLGAAPTWRRARSIMYLRANESLFPTLTGREALALAGQHDQVSPAEIAERRISELSGGQRKKLALLCSVRSPPPPVCLYDEPFLSLDSHGLNLLQTIVHASLRESAVLIALPSTLSW